MSQGETDDARPVEGRPPTESEIDWIKVGYEARRSSITFLNDAAKLLLSLPSGLSTLYLAVLAGVSLAASMRLDAWAVSPIAAWVASGGFALWALFPRRYEVHSDSPSDIEVENTRTVKLKLYRLRTSGVLLLIGVLLAAWVIFDLMNQPDIVESIARVLST